MNPADSSRVVKRLAADEGFDRCGIVRAAPIGRIEYIRTWLSSGRAGTMDYLHRYFTERTDPSMLFEGAISVVVVALLYHQHLPARGPGEVGPRGRVAQYAWGDDYHEAVKAKLVALADRMRAELSETFEVQACVDTVPILERELAAAAGIGWIGKNTMVLTPKLGSYFFLGELVTTLDLSPDDPMPDHCGTCTACLDACPTGAFPAPYEMDASRCISYLTIEHRGSIPEEFKRSMGDWIFGCDVCQEVCPHNRRAPIALEPLAPAKPLAGSRAESARAEALGSLLLEDILSWSPEDYSTSLRGSAMKRAKLPMLQRNARIALENLRR